MVFGNEYCLCVVVLHVIVLSLGLAEQRETPIKLETGSVTAKDS